MADISYPTEVVKLPSGGKLYPSTSPLHKGEIEIKYLTSKEEDILSNRNYIANETVIKKFLEAVIVTPGVNLDELLGGDMDCIFYSARVLAYGEIYKYPSVHPITRNPDIATVDLNTIENLPLHEVIENATQNEFEFKLPAAKIPVTFKLLTQSDTIAMKQELKTLTKLFPDGSFSRTLFMIYSLTSINGDRNKVAIRDFVEKNIMLARDSQALRSYISKISPGLNTKVEVTYSNGYQEESEVDVTSEFLWPTLE